MLRSKSLTGVTLTLLWVLLLSLAIATFFARKDYYVELHPLVHQKENAWILKVEGFWLHKRISELICDSYGSDLTSSLVLYENGRLLKPARSLRTTIILTGGGAYSHWGKMQIHSSSGGTFPYENGYIHCQSSA